MDRDTIPVLCTHCKRTVFNVDVNSTMPLPFKCPSCGCYCCYDGTTGKTKRIKPIERKQSSGRRFY